jgi:hypothetical protein
MNFPGVENERRDRANAHPQNFHRSGDEAVPCLLAVEGGRLKRFEFIFEPACGDGALVVPLRDAGFKVIASDLIDRGCPDSHVQDFLAADFGTKSEGQRRRIACFTNPPFDRADAFILKACANYDYVAMILRLRYLAPQHLIDDAGQGDIHKNAPIWQQTRIPLARVIIPKARWKMMHRDGYAGPKLKGGLTDYAIFIWEAGHSGSPLIVKEPDRRFLPTLNPHGAD